MTFHICIVYHLLFVSAGKMTEGSRITPPYRAVSQLYHHCKLAVLQEGSSSHLQLLFPGLHCLFLAAVSSSHRPHCAPGGGTHFSTAKPRGGFHLEQFSSWLHEESCWQCKSWDGNQALCMELLHPKHRESRGCRSRGKCFMIAVSKCSINHP